MLLKGKTAIITGASRGIGRAIALKFAEEGAKLTLAARNEEALNDLKSEIAKKEFARTVCCADRHYKRAKYTSPCR